MNKAYLYCRVSSLEQTDGFGIQRQINSLMDFLENAELPKALGYQLDPHNFEVLESDQGLSGYKGHNFTKGSLGLFKKRVASGEITSGCLLIESVDRFSRKQQFDAIEEFTFLIRRNIDIIEIDTGTIFSTKIDHKLTELSTSIERAYQESKRKSRMVTKSWANLKRIAVEDGIALKRNVPYWLGLEGDNYGINLPEVERIRAIFNDYANGKGVTSIVRELNRTGGKYDGKFFSTNFLNVMLRDVRLIGWLRGKKRPNESVAEWKKRQIKIYPEVIDPILFELVQRKIDANSERKKNRTSSKQVSLFNGVARCGLCNEPLIGHFTAKGNYLRCLGKRSKLGTCNSNLIRYANCESAIINHVKNIDFNAIYNVKKDNTQQVELLQKQMSVVVDEINEIESLLNSADNASEIVPLTKARREKVKEKEVISIELADLTRQVIHSDEELTVNVNEVIDQSNIELRQKYNLALKKSVKTIKIIQDNSRSEKVFVVKFEYHYGYVMHYVALDMEGTVLAYSYIEDKEHVCMKSSCMDINFSSGEIETKHAPNEIEHILVEKTLDHIRQVLLGYDANLVIPEID